MQNLESAQDHLPPLTLTALERACSYIFQEDHRLTGFGCWRAVPGSKNKNIGKLAVRAV